MRAASTACTVSGTENPIGSWPNHQPPFWRPTTPRSVSVAISSSTKNGNNSDQVRSAVGDGAVIGLPQGGQLAIPADEHRLQAADPARAHQRQCAHQLAADDPAGFAFACTVAGA